jgi:hypothetical protein
MIFFNPRMKAEHERKLKNLEAREAALKNIATLPAKPAPAPVATSMPATATATATKPAKPATPAPSAKLTGFEKLSAGIAAQSAPKAPTKAPKLTAASPSVIHRASKTQAGNTAKTADPKAGIATAPKEPDTVPEVITAAAFKTPRRRMLRSEWVKLSDRDKKRFSDEYGIIV